MRLQRDAWPVLPIFRLIQQRGAIEEQEMYRVFNMGIGLVLIIPPGQVGRAREALPEARVIGEAVAWAGSGARVLL
mgnify:FL=1